MAKYQVTLTYEVWYTAEVEAEDYAGAEDSAWALLQEEGRDAFKEEGGEWADYIHTEEID